MKSYDVCAANIMINASLLIKNSYCGTFDKFVLTHCGIKILHEVKYLRERFALTGLQRDLIEGIEKATECYLVLEDNTPEVFELNEMFENVVNTFDAVGSKGTGSFSVI